MLLQLLVWKSYVRSISEVEKEARDKAAITMAINSLSYSEKEAIEHIFEELGGTEGLLIASKVADQSWYYYDL